MSQSEKAEMLIRKSLSEEEKAISDYLERKHTLEKMLDKAETEDFLIKIQTYLTVLEDIIDDVTSIACDISNRDKNDVKLQPYIKKAVKSEYLARGAEGLKSRTEGSVSTSFNDIIEKLRNDIIKNGLRRIK